MPRDPLSPAECMVALIDHQPQKLFEADNYDRRGAINNAVGLARAAKLFGVPVVLSTIETPGFSGYMLPRLGAVFPDALFRERKSMNAWEDAPFRLAVAATGRRKLVLAGLWTNVCVTFPAIQALAEGYKVHVVEDACGDMSEGSHSAAAMTWMVQAGAVPLTWVQTVLDWQRDRPRARGLREAAEIVRDLGISSGVGIGHARPTVGSHAPKTLGP